MEPGGLGGEVVLLAQVVGAGGGGPELGDGGVDVAGPLEQVGAHGPQAVVVAEPLLETSSSARPASGPWSIAAATARLSVTIGLAVSRSGSV